MGYQSIGVLTLQRLSYWVCLLTMDLVEMAVLGRWAQALLYWPGVSLLLTQRTPRLTLSHRRSKSASRSFL